MKSFPVTVTVHPVFVTLASCIRRTLSCKCRKSIVIHFNLQMDTVPKHIKQIIKHTNGLICALLLVFFLTYKKAYVMLS